VHVLYVAIVAFFSYFMICIWTSYTRDLVYHNYRPPDIDSSLCGCAKYHLGSQPEHALHPKLLICKILKFKFPEVNKQKKKTVLGLILVLKWSEYVPGTINVSWNPLVLDQI
jgi:hypothetical protein